MLGARRGKPPTHTPVGSATGREYVGDTCPLPLEYASDTLQRVSSLMMTTSVLTSFTCRSFCHTPQTSLGQIPRP